MDTVGVLKRQSVREYQDKSNNLGSANGKERKKYRRVRHSRVETVMRRSDAFGHACIQTMGRGAKKYDTNVENRRIQETQLYRK